MDWTEGREWLTHNTDADVMFCEWHMPSLGQERSQEPVRQSLSVCMYVQVVTPRAHARSGVKQSVLSVSLSVAT